MVYLNLNSICLASPQQTNEQLWALGHKILIWRWTTLPKYVSRIQAFCRMDILALGCWTLPHLISCIWLLDHKILVQPYLVIDHKILVLRWRLKPSPSWEFARSNTRGAFISCRRSKTEKVSESWLAQWSREGDFIFPSVGKRAHVVNRRP